MSHRIIGLLACVGWLCGTSGCGQPSATHKPDDSPAQTTAAALSVPDHPQPTQGYIGSQRCRECHQQQSQAFQPSAHHHALATLESELEPPDGEFLHARSGRHYRVYRRDGELRHREWLGDEDSESSIVADYAVQFRVGSGHHSRTYLAEIDGFLVESPITWYTSRQSWGLSPGYDIAHPASFERAADLGCLNCHVSRAETLDGTYHRINFLELGIGCERCHGPGADHVRVHQLHADPAPDGAEQIVHPGKIPRTLTESICAQCHLRGDATVFHPGESAETFRPGQSLSSVRIDFQAVTGDNEMTVVGHMEQMWRSRCYQGSTQLTCISCHEIHGPHTADPAATRELSRKQCFQCHTNSSCGLPTDAPQRQERNDDCLHCHMPQTTTDIPHLAFTHHRIAVHQETPNAPQTSEKVQLVPIGDVTQVPSRWQERARGLALLEYAQKQSDPNLRRALATEGYELLAKLVQRGGADGDMLASVAQGLWEQSPAECIPIALDALNRPETTAGLRANMALLLADSYLTLNRHTDAQSWADHLIHLRRHSSDWELKAATETDSIAALADLKRAVDIQPFRPDLQRILSEMLAAQGQTAEAQQARRRWKLLQQQSPQ